jgi:hypothetical protein
MRRLWTVEGLPTVIPKELLDGQELLKRLFEDDQIEGTSEKYISSFVVDVQITHVGIHRKFPLIVKRDPKTHCNINCNECVCMTLDNIGLQDLIKYQKIEYKILRGYYWTGKRDYRIRDAIHKIFTERARLKNEGNATQEVLKLIMNSAYGKSIQKAILKTTKYVKKEDADWFEYSHYNMLLESYTIANSNIIAFELNKCLDDQFNNCLFGVQVLSMSKRIMNEVMCLAEDLNIGIYYQDTDSMHIEKHRLQELAEEFEKIYNRKLIGEGIMGCFHNDFDELKNGYCIRHISLGKKMYFDKLINSLGNTAIHFRMKGIPQICVTTKAEELNMTVEELYEYMSHDNFIDFQIGKTKVQFKMNKNGMITHDDEFHRRVQKT